MSRAPSGTDARLDRLEGAVNLLLERLSDTVRASEHRSPTPSRTPIQAESLQRSRGASLDEDAPAPVFVLRDLAAETGNTSQLNGQSPAVFGEEDIIQAGILSQSDAALLIRM